MHPSPWSRQSTSTYKPQVQYSVNRDCFEAGGTLSSRRTLTTATNLWRAPGATIVVRVRLHDRAAGRPAMRAVLSGRLERALLHGHAEEQEHPGTLHSSPSEASQLSQDTSLQHAACRISMSLRHSAWHRRVWASMEAETCTRVCSTGLHIGIRRPEGARMGSRGAHGALHVSPASSDTCQYSACCSLPSPGTVDACNGHGSGKIVAASCDVLHVHCEHGE